MCIHTLTYHTYILNNMYSYTYVYPPTQVTHPRTLAHHLAACRELRQELRQKVHQHLGQVSDRGLGGCRGGGWRVLQ